MDAKKTLKKYLGPNIVLRVCCWLFILAALVSLFLSISKFCIGRNAEAVEFYPDTKVGAYAWLDISGVSDWVCGYDDGDTYYVAIDPDWYFYVVCLSDKDFASMGEYLEYWESDDPDAVMPAPTRYYGEVRRMNNDMVDSFCDYFEVDKDELDYYFGGRYLDTTATPGKSDSDMWAGIGLLTFLVWALFAVATGTKSRNVKKSLAALELSNSLELAASELEAPNNLIFGKNDVILSRSFIFCRTSGAVVRYTDLIWCFKRVQRTNFVPTATSLIGNTRKMRDFVLVSAPAKDNAGITDQVMEVIYSHNPNIMLGFTNENKQAYNEIFKSEKGR